MIVGAIILGVAPAIAMRLASGLQVTPDGMQYAAMGRGEHVARPYSLRMVAKWIPPTTEAWTVASAAGLLTSVISLYVMTVHVSGSDLVALGACGLFGALPYTRRLLVWSVLTDAMSLGAIGIVGVLAIYAPFFAVFIIGFLWVIHERSIVHATLLHWWITDSYWAILPMVAGLIYYGYAHRSLASHPNEQTVEYLAHPFRSAIASHRKVLFDGSYWLLPWGASLAWIMQPTWQLGVVAVVSYAPCLVAMDRVRVYQANPYPFVIASAVVLPVEWWLPAYLVTLFMKDGAI